jgi:chorismate mutase
MLDEKIVFLLAVFFAILIITMMFYLQGTIKEKNLESEKDPRFDDKVMKELYYMTREQGDRLRHEFQELNERISNKLNELGQLNSIEFTDSDKAKLLNIIESKIEKTIADRVISSFEENYAKSAFLKSTFQEILSDLKIIQQRLYREISKLSLRANLNLAIGSATTIVAILILYLTVGSHTSNFDSISHSMSFFIPRISIVVFIEIFSFFFLKLYRTNLSDIKYYQNEMTNVEFKLLALKSAFAKDDLDSIKSVITNFSTIERNFILKKGESTVEVEKSKIDLASENSWKEIVKEALKLKQK